MGRPLGSKNRDAALLEDDNLRKTVLDMEADAGGEVPIIGVTGGTTHEEKESEGLGKMIWVVVREVDKPTASDTHVVSMASRAGAYRKVFRANKETVLPEKVVEYLEDLGVHNSRPVNIGPDGMRSIEEARRLNPTMDVMVNDDGDAYLTEFIPRFHVRRLNKPYRSA